jgi:hypothetical protein
MPNDVVNSFIFLVDRTLAGEQPKQLEIASYLYPKEQDSEERDVKARQAVGDLRDALLKYYNSHGKTDATNITIPIGGYRVEWKWQCVSTSEDNGLPPQTSRAPTGANVKMALPPALEGRSLFG